MERFVLTYVPVMHAGYRAFFERHRGADGCLVIDETVMREVPEIRKDIRRLASADAVTMVKSLGIFRDVRAIALPELKDIWMRRVGLILSNDEMMRKLYVAYCGDLPVEFDTAFLRYEKKAVEEPKRVTPDEVVLANEAHQLLMERAAGAAAFSSDWWRRVGAVLVTQDGSVYCGYNRHLPDEYAPYYAGDPRMFFSGGVAIELSTAFHAEKTVIAAAVNVSQRLRGASLYVTTFPCPPCAKDIAAFGIRTLYFSEGYALLDGESVLRDAGVRIIRVEKKNPETS